MNDDRAISAIDAAALVRIGHLFDVLCDESMGQNEERKRQALSRFRSGLASIRAAHVAAVASVGEEEGS